jgi:HrpA-like RNA helicase
MSLPTLLRKGFIVPQKGMSESDKKKLENTVAIDFILNFISSRIPERRNSVPKLSAKKYGDKVIVLKSDTGSGKSTVLPPKLYTTFFQRTKKNIIVTQPRILTAVDIPSIIVPFYPELELDKNIGYNTGSFKRLPQEKGVIFSTVGVLTQQLIMDEDKDFMKRYQFIIIDEVHERDIETDLCLFNLKKLLQNNYNNPECPLVIMMSATFDEKPFINYFDVPQQNFIQVIGSTFPIEANFPDYSISNYLSWASMKSQQLHLNNIEDISNNDNFRDIIIFVKDTGIGRKIYEELHHFNTMIDKGLGSKYSENLEVNIERLYKRGGSNGGVEFLIKNPYILPILLDRQSFESGGLEYQNLFSKITTINVPIWETIKDKIDFEQPPKKYVIPTRRIIIATNIAETGVTIPTLKYCIDTGFHINVEFNPEVCCNLVFSKNITRGMAVQRKGRVGRNAPGFWYPCYTKETFESMSLDQFSKIIVSDTTENLLGILIKETDMKIVEESSKKKINEKPEDIFQMFKLGSNTWYKPQYTLNTNISGLDFIEMPSIQALSFSMEKLHLLGFIDDEYRITITGFFSNQIRFIPIEAKKMIFAGYANGANILDLITIASFIYVSKRRIFAKAFKITNFLKQAGIAFEFYNRVLFADDFINSLFIWNIFQGFIQRSVSDLNFDIVETISEKDKRILYSKDIEKWCDNNGIFYSGLLSVISTRDQLIENMINVGLNPYFNGLNISKNEYNLNKILNSSLEEGLNEIKKIKQSIYSGYICNILKFRKGRYYSLLRNIPIKVKSIMISELNNEFAEQTKPMYIAVDNYTMSSKFGSSQFEFISDSFVSVLDNYISPDEKFHMY